MSDAINRRLPQPKTGAGRDFCDCRLDVPAERLGTFETELADEFMVAFARELGASLHVRKLAGRNRPFTSLVKVVLPAPFWPTSATSSPGCKLRETRSTPSVLP